MNRTLSKSAQCAVTVEALERRRLFSVQSIPLSAVPLNYGGNPAVTIFDLIGPDLADQIPAGGVVTVNVATSVPVTVSCSDATAVYTTPSVDLHTGYGTPQITPFPNMPQPVPDACEQIDLPPGNFLIAFATSSDPLYSRGFTETLNAAGNATSFNGPWVTVSGESGGTNFSILQPFIITNVDQLVFFREPVNSFTNVPMASPVGVEILDVRGNLVTPYAGNTNNFDGDVLDLSLSGGPAGAAISTGNLSQKVFEGIVYFSGLAINTPGIYTLNVTYDVNTVAASDTFTVTNPKLAFIQQPANSIVGSTMPPAIMVAVEDASGNIVQNDDVDVVTLASVAAPVGGMLSGTVTKTVVNGIATFTDLSFNQAGSYALNATTGDATVNSAAFHVVNPPQVESRRLIFLSQPVGPKAAGILTEAVSVAIVDSKGRVVIGDSSTVSLTLAGNGDAALGGTIFETAARGIATFNNLALDGAGTYKLIATDGKLKSATSRGFVIDGTSAGPLHLAWLQQPGNQIAGPISPVVAIAVENQFGELVVEDRRKVYLTIVTGSGHGKVKRIPAVVFQDGVASFPEFVIKQIGTYALSASVKGLTDISSDSFAVAAGPPAKLVFSVQPANLDVYNEQDGFVVEAVDQFNNLATNDTSTVTISGVMIKPWLDPYPSEIVVQGSASFYMTVLGFGAFRLTASDSQGLAPTQSRIFRLGLAYIRR